MRSQPAVAWLQARSKGRKASSSGLSFVDTGLYFSDWCLDANTLKEKQSWFDRSMLVL